MVRHDNWPSGKLFHMKNKYKLIPRKWFMQDFGLSLEKGPFKREINQNIMGKQ